MSKKERIASLERKAAHLADLIDIIISQDPDELARIESIEQRLDYLESMIRHYIALYEEQERQRVPEMVIQDPTPMPWQNPIISSAGNTPTAAVPTRDSLRPKATVPTE